MAFKQWPDAIVALPGHLAAALSGKALNVVSIFQLMGGAALLLLVVALFFQKKQGHAARLIWFALLAFIGIGSSVLLYGLGYYGVIGLGTMSRTTLGISLWLAMLVFIFLRAALLWHSTIVRLVAFGAVGHALSLLVPALIHQQDVWAKAWSESKRVIMSAPAREISATPANATIVYVGPNTIESMTFVGTWELTGGIWLMHPSTRLTSILDQRGGPILSNASTSGSNTRFITAKANYHTLTWDGKMLVMSLPGHWTSPMAAEVVYEWDAYRSTFRKVNPGESFGEAPASGG
ncbi:MAG: hypothetical protein GZ085_09885 [Sulfuriferula multivorans]|uniref:Uncharacterized protein n=1 Tax=Sulfuriferula multivorans TaxID=1559896 RepID=A0A7C9NU44_9PROT|nr:hypothetical protein [Sulfuriferula multivorans]